MLREEKHLTPLQIKTSLFVVYSAGSDTTAGLLNYLLWQLGKHPELQEEIFRDMNASKEDLFTYATQSTLIHQVISESLRLFTPAYVIGRVAAQPFICTVKDKSGKVLFKEKVEKNEKLLSAPTFAGRDPFLFQKADAFHPERFDAGTKNYSWLPFGDGAHACPGQWLAKVEVSLVVARLIQKYRFESFPEKEFQQLGYISLKPAEQTILKLILRN
jgi:cytochrome P450